MPETPTNLVIVHTPGLQALSDFTTVKSIIARRAPDIETSIVTNGNRHPVTRRQAARRPTLVFSPVPIREFSAMRGKICACRHLGKLEELRRMAKAGIRVPDAVLLRPETQLDPESWGPFIVLKPTWGRQGKEVRLVRTRDVGPGDRGKIAQKFIDTGPCPQYHRVMTVFGRPLFSYISTALDACPRLDPAGDAAVDLPIAANAGERRLALCGEPEIIDHARAIARAFPDIPVLGIDIIRESSTGLLYALEVNSVGYTWHLSSERARPFLEKHGIDLYGQFGALEIVADALIDTTRREAE